MFLETCVSLWLLLESVSNHVPIHSFHVAFVRFVSNQRSTLPSCTGSVGSGRFVELKLPSDGFVGTTRVYYQDLPGSNRAGSNRVYTHCVIRRICALHHQVVPILWVELKAGPGLPGRPPRDSSALLFRSETGVFAPLAGAHVWSNRGKRENDMTSACDRRRERETGCQEIMPGPLRGV